MYRVLLVDDELPALRYWQNIFDKLVAGFRVVDTCTSGEQAIEVLKQHAVDLLITDISMHGMSGIELARYARAALPAIHILIVSGYSEFEYAQCAIQLGVDDYLLKPVSITKMIPILNAIREKLDAEQHEQAAILLPALACGQAVSDEDITRLFGNRYYRFAVLRWGNLNMTLPRTLSSTSLIYPPHEYFYVLRGRDDNERILISPEDNAERFLAALSIYTMQQGKLSTWTVIYANAPQPIRSLRSYIELAMNMLYRRTVIGMHQILQLTGENLTEEKMKLPAADLKQLNYFISVGKPQMLKEYFLSMAAEWDREHIPQRQIWHMIRQLIHQTAATNMSVFNRLDDVLQEFNDLISCASSYGELVCSVYSLLFDNNNIRDKKLSTRELYDYAVQYIAENYSHALSMQSVCEELGISHTYLSRLFRKYGNVTFNIHLTRCRMEAAKKLLKEKPELLLRDVAACVGYEDSSYFTKVFHQYTGQTPSQYTAQD
ncbi:MAG: response regulator [Clostridia bacterium]|nr:response regulator [Clostridia bacterium]